MEVVELLLAIVNQRLSVSLKFRDALDSTKILSAGDESWTKTSVPISVALVSDIKAVKLALLIWAQGKNGWLWLVLVVVCCWVDRNWGYSHHSIYMFSLAMVGWYLEHQCRCHGVFLWRWCISRIHLERSDAVVRRIQVMPWPNWRCSRRKPSAASLRETGVYNGILIWNFQP